MANQPGPGVMDIAFESDEKHDDKWVARSRDFLWLENLWRLITSPHSDTQWTRPPSLSAIPRRPTIHLRSYRYFSLPEGPHHRNVEAVVHSGLWAVYLLLPLIRQDHCLPHRCPQQQHRTMGISGFSGNCRMDYPGLQLNTHLLNLYLKHANAPPLLTLTFCLPARTHLALTTSYWAGWTWLWMTARERFEEGQAW